MLAKVALAVIACAAAASAFTCPEDDHSFYHADVSSGCTVYHLCQNGQLQTLNCPPQQAFNHETSQCEDASTVSCVETMDHHHMHHHHHKRAVEVYHTINIKAVKDKAVELYKTVMPIYYAAFRDVAPTIHYKFDTEYLPALKRIRDEVLPIFYDKVWPQLVKFAEYTQKLAGKLFERAYLGYEMSNSTHVVVPSLDDLAQDVSNDLKPVIELGRYMSARLLSTKTRPKRSAPYEFPALIEGFIEPIVRSIASSVGASLSGHEDTVTSKIILPIVYEMMEDPETRFDLMRCFYSTKAAFSPLIWEMLSKQTFNTPEGTVIKIPRASFELAKARFHSETLPIVRKIAEKHLSMILRRASENVPLILRSIDMMKQAKKPHQGVLKDAILNFVTKHGSLLQSSNSKYVHTYTFTEIKNDLRPIYITLFQIAVDYFSQNQNHWLNIFLNKESPIYKGILGSQVYARPAVSVSTASRSQVTKAKVMTKKVVYKSG